MDTDVATALLGLAERISRLEQTTGVAQRDIPIPCPFCDDINVRVIKITEREPSICVTYIVLCEHCGASGPKVKEEKDAILVWNKFVSHHGKVQP